MEDESAEPARTELAGATALLAAAVVALVWANSPWKGSYARAWATPVRLTIGTIGFRGDLKGLIDDGLMAVFFFVVGLEIKRELVGGRLSHWRTAAFPAIAALGGMVVPALLFVAVNAGHVGARGWGIPMATDIAFALGALALVGTRAPSSLKLFLLTLAVVDDLGAIAVIALWYSHGIDVSALLIGIGLLVLVAVLVRAGVRQLWPYAALAAAVWLAFYQSGVHATIAGVALALIVPAGPMAARAEHELHPLSSFVIVPLFALANAGVVLSSSSVRGPGALAVTIGVVLGLVIGKPVGITLFGWAGVKLGVAHRPADMDWRHLIGVGAVAGIGFTVSLFVTELAFGGAALSAAAKIGIVTAS